MPIRSHTLWTWLSRWLDSRMAMPRSRTSRRRSSSTSVDAERVDGGRWFVEDQDVGVLHERVSDAQALEHAARIRLGLVVGAIGQPDLVEDLVDGRFREVAR